MKTDTLTPSDIYAAGYEIKKDTETDYFRFCARNWVEDSGLFDTPEEAADALRKLLSA